MSLCPCGSNRNYDVCCGLYIDGNQKPLTPEDLMRSRYTAYSQAKVEYIAKTMRSPAADGFDLEGARHWASRVKWLRLSVHHAEIDMNKGFVEFSAFYQDGKKEQVIHEISEFHLIDGVWFYVNGVFPDA